MNLRNPTTGQTIDQLDRHCANKTNIHSLLCQPEYNKDIHLYNNQGTDRSSLRLCSRYTGSIFGPVRKSIRYNVNSAWGNRTGPDRSGVELFTPYRIDICFCLAKANFTLESNRVITSFRSKNGADPLNRSFTLGAKRSKKLSDMERITCGIGAFQLVIITGIVPDRRGQM